MYHRLIALPLLLLSFAVLATAQQVPDLDFREELRFADALRTRGDYDLALEVIEKLSKTAPPEQAKELSLEKAKIRLQIAGDARDTTRRLRLYREAGLEFQKFIDENPNHPRIAEANLDVARVLNLTGRTELNKALLAEGAENRKTLATQARTTLVQAGTKLKAAAEALENEKAKLPDPATIADAKKKKDAEADLAKIDRIIKDTQIERGLNLYDQAETYMGAINLQVSNLFEAAKKMLDPISSGPASDPATWKAQAWSGRIAMRLSSHDAARIQFAGLIGTSKADTPVNTEGRRLAKYFQMLLFKEKPPEEVAKVAGGLNKLLMASARDWRRQYSRYLKTPEGAGVTFLLAQVLIDETFREKGPNKATIDAYRAEARKYLTELERSENEFTERARRLKFRIIAQQGVLDKAIDKLDNFEDCFVRAQYESYQMSLDPVEENEKQLKQIDLKKIEEGKDKKELAAAQARIKRLEEEIATLKGKGGLEKWRKARIDSIMQALNRGLELNAKAVKDKRKPGDVELDSARALLAYWSLNTQKYKEAIEHGEAFAFNASAESSAQAAECAIYALQAYVALLAKKPDDDDLRARFMNLCQFMERSWPGDLAGDLAAHNVALSMLHTGNPREAIKKLTAMGPTSANFIHTRSLLAEIAMKADKDGVEPIEGDRPGDYRKRALMALASMPDGSLGTDWLVNVRYVSGKVQLAAEVYRFGRYNQMDEIATKLMAEIEAKPDAPFSEEKEKDADIRDKLKLQMASLKIFAKQGLADEALAAKDFAKVAQILDPIVDAVVKKDDSQERTLLKDNQQLSGRMLQSALKANLQLGKLDRTEVVLQAMNKVSADENAAGATTILQLMAGIIANQVDDLRKKNDKEGLDRAIKGYTAILDRQVAKVKGAMKPDFLRVLAACYSNMGEHGKAADLLLKIPDPKAKPKSDEEKIWKAVQILLVRELRLSANKDNLKKAREKMDEMRGPAAPKTAIGWARQDLLALIEHAKLLQAEENWGEAFLIWSARTGIVAALTKQFQTGGDRVKELYYDAFYNMCLCGVKVSQAKTDPTDRAKGLDATAAQIVNHEKSYEDFGGETWKKLFTELLASDPVLKEKYEARKNKGK